MENLIYYGAKILLYLTLLAFIAIVLGWKMLVVMGVVIFFVFIFALFNGNAHPPKEERVEMNEEDDVAPLTYADLKGFDYYSSINDYEERLEEMEDRLQDLEDEREDALFEEELQELDKEEWEEEKEKLKRQIEALKSENRQLHKIIKKINPKS